MLGGYSVGIEIHLIDHVTAAMANVNKALIMAQGNTTAFQKALEKNHAQMMKFQAMEFAGNNMFQGAAAGLNAMVDPAREYAHQLGIMNMNAMDFHEQQMNIAAAWDTSFKIPSTPTENLQALKDMHTIFGDTHEAYEESRHLLPEFQKIQTILAASVHDPSHSAGDSTNQIFSAVKAMEMQGKVRNPEEFQHGIEQMTRVMVATGGRVLPSDYQSMAKYARSMKLTLDDDFWFKVAPELILEMKSVGGGAGGAGGPGAMIAAVGRALVQDIMSDKARAALGDLGVLNDEGQFIDRELAAKNPERAVNEIMIPAILKQHPEFEGDQMAINLALNELRLPGLSGSLVGELFNKDKQIDKFGAILDKIGGVDELYNKAIAGSPFAQQQALQKSWETLLTSLGEVMVPFLPMVNMLSQSLQFMASVLKSNPWMAQMIVLGLVATAIVGATIAIIGAIGGLVLILPLLGITGATFVSTVGIVIGSIAALTGSLMILANMGSTFKQMWDGLISGFMNFGAGMQSFGDGFKALSPETIMPFFSGIMKLPGFVNPAMPTFEPASGGKKDAKDPRLTPIKPLLTDQKKAQAVQMTVPQIVVNGTKEQSPEDIAGAVKDMLIKVMQEGLLTGVGHTGLLFGHEIYE